MTSIKNLKIEIAELAAKHAEIDAAYEAGDASKIAEWHQINDALTTAKRILRNRLLG